jgi:preprotein translocase subunit SecB
MCRNMADDPKTEPATLAPNGEDTSPQIGLISQYVKDLSFENPSAPAVYQWEGAPRIEIQFNISSAVVADDVHEVVLKIDISANGNAGVAFVIDLSYAGLFGMRNVPEDQVQAFLFAEGPRIIFPFARRIIADVVRDGGFQPLLLDPIDFHGLYLQQAHEQSASADGGETQEQPTEQ